MKKISFLFAFLCTSVMSFAQESVVASCDFTAQTATHTNYNDTWTYGDWSVYGAANNNGGWTYAKFGGKKATLENANPCYIFGQVNEPVTKIVITTNAGNLTKAGSVNEWGVIVYSDAQKKNMIAQVKGGTMTKGKSETLELIPTVDAPWTGKSYYQVYFDLANTTTTNGIVWIDKIEFYAAPTASVPATAITIDKTALSVENYKNTIALTATLTPENATDEIVWTSANEEIATISKMGVISALKEGTVTLTATAGSVSATCELTVTAPTILTCAQAAEIAKAVSANNVKAENGKFVVRGYMTAEGGKGFSSDMTNYQNISFWMADERGTAKTFEAYQVKPLDAENLPEVGALVEIVGDLTKYNTTYETTGGGSATMRVIENAPLQYELNGGVLASTPAPATTNLELWEVFKPAYNKYYNLARADQPIDKVPTFAANLMQDFMTDEASDWKWLGDYILSVVQEANFNNGALTSEVLWRFNVSAFFNCAAANTSTWNGNPDFTEAGKPEKWIAAWDATHTAILPEHPTEATELPIPTREGYVFAGWYNNAEFTGEAITTVDATTKGTLYANWKVEVIPATAIKMSEIGLNMIVGETFTLTVAVTPEDASLEGLTWTSSDTTLATVKDGVVTAIAPTPDYDYVTITATLGELTATCDVVIYAALESIRFDITEMDTVFEYEENLEIPLTFDIQPINASTDGIIVTSSNTAVATIEEQSFFGMTFFTMHVVGVGTTTLKVTTADGKLSDELVITVTPPAVHATAVTVDKEELTLSVGDTYQLVATMVPENAVDVIEWNSSKSSVATVENGLVTAVGVGEATIWITAGWEASATCSVTVVDQGTNLNDIAELDTNAPIYNVLGQEVSAEYKGVVIQNGKKFLQK